METTHLREIYIREISPHLFLKEIRKTQDFSQEFCVFYDEENALNFALWYENEKDCIAGKYKLIIQHQENKKEKYRLKASFFSLLSFRWLEFYDINQRAKKSFPALFRAILFVEEFYLSKTYADTKQPPSFLQQIHKMRVRCYHEAFAKLERY